MKDRNIHNVVRFTADVHYASATQYRPEQVRFSDFKPFWECVGGPIHAGTLSRGIPKDMKQNRAGPFPASLTTTQSVLKASSVARVFRHNRAGADGKDLIGQGRDSDVLFSVAIAAWHGSLSTSI